MSIVALNFFHNLEFIDHHTYMKYLVLLKNNFYENFLFDSFLFK